MITINPSAYDSVFVLPSSVADKHIRLAGAVQLKVLLWIFRHSAEKPEIQDVSSALGIPCADISDALQYWIESGIISISEPSAVPETGRKQTENSLSPVLTLKESGQISFFENTETSSEPTVKTEENKKTGSVFSDKIPIQPEHIMPPAVRPTHEQIAARITESRDIRGMFFEVERIFGRTLGYDTQSSLLYLTDHEGLPPEVVVMLCEYAQSIGKKSVRYIEKIGEDWAENDIDTFEKAAKRIAALEGVNSLWNELKVMMGLDNPKPTSRQREYLIKWSNSYEYNAQMIFFAYERMIEKTGKLNFKYMDTMLTAWHNSGFKTQTDVEKQDEKFREKSAEAKKSALAASTGGKASYDIEKAFNPADIPTKTKKSR